MRKVDVKDVLFTGKKSFEAPSGYRYSIVCTNSFSVFALRKGKRVELLGSREGENLGFSFVLPPEFDGYEVEPWAKPGHFSVKGGKPKGEELSDVPVAFPPGVSHVEDLQETIRRFVASEFEALAPGAGSPEEENDFEIEEDDWPMSPYEYQELQEEHHVPEKAPESPVAPEPAQEDPQEVPPVRAPQRVPEGMEDPVVEAGRLR